MRADTTARFWAKVRKGDVCWTWQGATVRGYGVFWNWRKQVRATRFVYELAFGLLPAELHIDHLCRNVACVNPDHLEAVTKRENTLRGNGPTAANAHRTHCVNGHPFTPENTLWRKWSVPGRACRQCNRDKLRRRRRVAA